AAGRPLKPQHTDWLRQVDRWREQEPMRFADREDAILPQYAIERLWKIVRDRGQLDDTVVSTAGGQQQLGAAPYWEVTTPRRWAGGGGLRPARGDGRPGGLPGPDRH